MYVCCLQSRSCLALIRCVWQGGREQYSSKPSSTGGGASSLNILWHLGAPGSTFGTGNKCGTPLCSLANSPCAKNESVPTLCTRVPLWISLHPCTCHLAFHPLQVTVYESLVFSARLRLPEENGGKVALVSRAACCMYPN